MAGWRARQGGAGGVQHQGRAAGSTEVGDLPFGMLLEQLEDHVDRVDGPLQRLPPEALVVRLEQRRLLSEHVHLPRAPSTPGASQHLVLPSRQHPKHMTCRSRGAQTQTHTITQSSNRGRRRRGVELLVEHAEVSRLELGRKLGLQRRQPPVPCCRPQVLEWKLFLL